MSSYLVLARKYRPRNFAEMVGQEHVVQALSNALTHQRLHHAYLFTGTRGVGKTTVSRILAKSLNCTGPDGQGTITATPCGTCPACREIDSGRFPDYVELDAASNRGVDEVQALLEQAVYKPVQGRFKVFMIDEVHMLTNTAFNAMLKTLEEPPEYLKFVLATTDPQKVPVTVLSRCLQFNLRPMAPDTVMEHLTRVLEQEHIPAEPQALRLLARGARGSMRDALSLTDQAIAFGSGQVQEAAVRQMLGSADHTAVFRLVQAVADGDGPTIVTTVDHLRHQGTSAAATLEALCAVLHRMAVMQATPGTDSAIDPADPEAADIARLAHALPADETQLFYSISLHGRHELGLAPDEYAALTMTLLRLLAFKPAAARPLQPPQPHQPGTHTNPAPTPTATPTPTPAPTPAMTATTAVAQAQTHIPPQQAAPELTSSSTPTPTPTSAAQPLPTHPATEPHPPVVATVAAPSIEIPPWEPLPDDAHPPTTTGRPQPAPPKLRTSPTTAGDTSTPSAAQQPQPTPAKAAPPGDAGELGAFWHTTVNHLVNNGALTALASQLAQHAELISRTPENWTLRIDRPTLHQPAHIERLARVLAEHAQCPGLTVEHGPAHDTPAQRNHQAHQARQHRAETIVTTAELVQTLMQHFPDATIVPGSIRPA